MTLVSKTLEQTGCCVVNTTSDTDCDNAVNGVKQSLWKDATVIGEYANLLILMLFYSWNPSFLKLIYRCDKGATKNSKIYDIYRYGQKLEDDICRSLLFIHAFTGCETSQFCTIKKRTAFKVLI